MLFTHTRAPLLLQGEANHARQDDEKGLGSRNMCANISSISIISITSMIVSITISDSSSIIIISSSSITSIVIRRQDDEEGLGSKTFELR